MSEKQPWHRQPRETVRAFTAFRIYLKLGPKRSIVKALDAAGEKPSNRRHWERWSDRWSWVDRCQAYDDRQFEIDLARREEAREKARQLFVEKLGDAAQTVLEIMGGEMPDGKTLPIMDTHQNVVGEKPLIDARARLAAAYRVLETAGLIIPRRVEMKDSDLEERRETARRIMQGMDAETLKRVAAALGLDL